MAKVLVCYIEGERETEGEREREGGREREEGGGREGGRERKRYNINMGKGKAQLYSST